MFGGMPPGSTRPRPQFMRSPMGGMPQQPSMGGMPQQPSMGVMPQQQPYQSYVQRMGGMPGLSSILNQGMPQINRDPAKAMSNPYWQARQAPPTDWQSKMTEMNAQIQALRNFQQQPQQQPQQPQGYNLLDSLNNQGS